MFVDLLQTGLQAVSFNPSISERDRLVARQHLERGRLAGTVGPEQAEAFVAERR